MTCAACLESAVRPSHSFIHGCQGCAARAVARGQNYREVQASGRQTWKYKEELTLLQVTHDEVRTAAAADALGVRA